MYIVLRASGTPVHDAAILTVGFAEPEPELAFADMPRLCFHLLSASSSLSSSARAATVLAEDS